MSQLLGSNFKKSIIDQIKKCSRSITIISPYVTLPAVKELAKALPESVKRRCLITSPPGVEYVTGSVDIEALEMLRQIGFEIRCLPDLHAKIYLLDEKNAYIGSANFTSNGWELSRSPVKGNVEDMIMIETSKSDRDHIISRYIINSDALDLNGDWKIEVEKYKVQFLNQYQKLMNSMVINYSTQEFPMYSDYQKPPNGYKCYFRFSIAKTTGNKIKMEKKNIILKLGGEKQNATCNNQYPF
ncbi:phospholipase D family protein [Paenibacillus sp. N3.4]|uniref:phospholipase D family protein n=1 Tax=Paenibacillus sp. N3.4 TaxID=2603222 RepID=UPI00164EE626|nr:phospholipase D family protein [Paenibacillus sp. N3.4]